MMLIITTTPTAVTVNIQKKLEAGVAFSQCAPILLKELN